MKNRNDKIKPILSAKSPAQRLSAILNHLMAESKIDGVQLSRRTGIPVTTINRLRKNDADNNPTLSTLVPLAHFFAITVSQLIGDEPIPDASITGMQNTGTSRSGRQRKSPPGTQRRPFGFMASAPGHLFLKAGPTTRRVCHNWFPWSGLMMWCGNHRGPNGF